LKELFLTLILLQAFAMLIDEFYFHFKRGLGKWESLGHPLDTLSVLFPFIILVFLEPTGVYKTLYIGLSIFSCVFVTKDEFVHQKLCSWQENWLHAVLFMLHPVLFICAYFLWTSKNYSGYPLGLEFSGFMFLQIIILTSFMLYQIIYWNKGRFYEFIKN